MRIKTDDIALIMHGMGERARNASRTLASAPAVQKNSAIMEAADLLRAGSDDIVRANMKDMEAALLGGSGDPFLDRLKLNAERIETIALGLEEIASLPDPVGRAVAQWDRPNGLRIERVSVPLGVIGVIYESRPNVTADAGAICLKSGNAVILRCGSESLHSSQAIVECLHRSLSAVGLPEGAIQLVPTSDRTAVSTMLAMTGHIDVIVPRGGKALTELVRRESRLPTIQHLDGNCHTYIHKSADPRMAKEVLLNAKLRRTGICGATESLLIDASAAERLLPDIIGALIGHGCEVLGDPVVQAIDARVAPAAEEDWYAEYLDAVISVKTVNDVFEAVEHIEQYGSHHTDSIIAEDKAAADFFLSKVDSAIVLHNASTQFGDGGEFGMGAEIGISTGRLHARGPVGVEQLTTYKYVVRGQGQTRP